MNENIFNIFKSAIAKLEYKNFTLTYSSPIDMEDGLDFGRIGGWTLHIRHKNSNGKLFHVSIEYCSDIGEFCDSTDTLHNKDINVLIASVIKEEEGMLESLENSF